MNSGDNELPNMNEKGKLNKENSKALFHAFLDQVIKEDAYLKQYERIFSSKDSHLDRLKLIVLRIHMDLEQLLNLSIEKPYLENLKISEEDFSFFENQILGRISFKNKIDILRKKNILKNNLIDKIKGINTLRNNLFHLTNKDLEYNGRKIKSDKTVIKGIVDDYLEISKYIIELNNSGIIL